MSEPMLFMGEFRSGRTQREWRGHTKCERFGAAFFWLLFCCCRQKSDSAASRNHGYQKTKAIQKTEKTKTKIPHICSGWHSI